MHRVGKHKQRKKAMSYAAVSNWQKTLDTAGRLFTEGKPQEAENTLKRALDMALQTGSYTLVAQTFAMQGMVMSCQGRDTEAEWAFRKSIDNADEQKKSDPVGFTSNVIALGLFLSNKQKLSDATEILLMGLELSTDFPELTPLTMLALVRLAACYLFAGKFKLARQAMTRVLTYYTSVYGSTDRRTLLAQKLQDCIEELIAGREQFFVGHLIDLINSEVNPFLNLQSEPQSQVPKRHLKVVPMSP